MHGEPDVAARIPRRINRLVVPLHEALRIRKAAVHFRHRRSGEEEDLSLDIGRFECAAPDFGVERRDVAIQCDYLTPELVRLAGLLGLGIEVSLYWSSDEDSGA